MHDVTRKGAAASAPKPMAILVDTTGISPLFTAADASERLTGSAFYWLDLFAGEESERKALLTQIGVDPTDLAWLQRFGQAGRLTVGQKRLRAVTWVADLAGSLIEIHLHCSGERILTVWRGDPAILDDIRQHFAERVGEVGKRHFQAAGILLQYLLATLDHAIRRLDVKLDHLRSQLDDGSKRSDYGRLASQRQEFQTAWVGFDRYGSAVRTAMVGIEAVPGMDPLGADELNDYAEQVEDFQQQLQERRRRLSDILHDAANAIAQQQGEQINRLTLVSLLFLPITAVTGFFGMNFNWMIDALNSESAFFTLGVILPSAMVLLTVLWLMSRGLLKVKTPPVREDAEQADP